MQGREVMPSLAPADHVVAGSHSTKKRPDGDTSRAAQKEPIA